MNWITQTISQIGYPAIFVLMALESALIPIPSEITMPFAGFLVGQGILNFGWVVLMGGVGNLVGSLIAYGLGVWWEKEFVHQLIRRYGRYLLITLKEVERVEKWFREKGEIIAFSSRLLPVVRTFISLPAGFSRMSLIKFSFYTLLGALIWSGFLAYLGMLLGENWTLLEVYFRRFEVVIVLIFLATAFIFFRHQFKKFKTAE